jgi:glycosyltransferase involved in cell wall biosynthesis
MPDAPEITVVIPSRNRWALLSVALRAALSQEGVELEVVVVDDGSSDETSSRLEGVRDPRLRVIRNESPRGVTGARNQALGVARGECLAFLDDDDIWSPRNLRTKLDLIEAQNADFAYAGAVALDGRRRVIKAFPLPGPGELAAKLLTYNVMPGGPSNVMANAALLRRLGGFDENLAELADWDLWIRLALAGRAAVCRDVLVGYTEHAWAMHALDRDDAIQNEFEHLAAKHRGAAKRAGVEFDRTRFAYWVASGHRRAGRRSRALRLYLRTAFGHQSGGSLLRAVSVLAGERATQIGRRLVGGRVPEPSWLELYR